ASPAGSARSFDRAAIDADDAIPRALLRHEPSTVVAELSPLGRTKPVEHRSKLFVGGIRQPGATSRALTGHGAASRTGYDGRPDGPTLEGHDGQAFEGRRNDGRSCGGERLHFFPVFEIPDVHDPGPRWQLHVRLAGEHQREIRGTFGPVARKVIEQLG